MKLAAAGGFTREAIANWTKANWLPGCHSCSNGLNCFAGVIDTSCTHLLVVVGRRNPRDMSQFTWATTILGNLKTMVGGGDKAFKFSKYANKYLGAFAYRFNHRVNL